jgi:hypothetical protein
MSRAGSSAGLEISKALIGCLGTVIAGLMTGIFAWISVAGPPSWLVGTTTTTTPSLATATPVVLVVTATPIPVTITPAPEVASPTPRATVASTPKAGSPMPCVETPTGFKVAWKQRRNELGCPTSSEISIPLRVQQFPHGIMFSRGDLMLIYVLNEDGTWRSPGQDGGPFALPSGLEEPKQGFAKVQEFERGTLLRDLDGMVYALYRDKKWEAVK